MGGGGSSKQPKFGQVPQDPQDRAMSDYYARALVANANHRRQGDRQDPWPSRPDHQRRTAGPRGRWVEHTGIQSVELAVEVDPSVQNQVFAYEVHPFNVFYAGCVPAPKRAS